MKITQTVEFNAPVATVWDAIIDHNKFGQWFRCKLDQPFKEGEDSTGMMTFPGTEHVKWQAKVVKVHNERSVAFSWPAYDEDETIDLSQEPWLLCVFELKSNDDGTILTITESGFEKLPSSIADQCKKGNEQGWKIQANHLQEYMAGS